MITNKWIKDWNGTMLIILVGKDIIIKFDL